MNRSDIDRIRDARDFAWHARNNAGGLPAEVLADAKQPQHAALYDLAIIGEALSKVSAELKSAAPDLPWRAVINMRNLIVHAYWQIDLEIVADVIEKRIDPLVAQLDKLIELVEKAER